MACIERQRAGRRLVNNPNPNPGSNPFAPPGAEVADVAVSGPRLAGRGNRLLAVIIDGLLQIGIMLLINWVLPLSLFDENPSFGVLVRNMLLGFGLFLLIQGWLLVTEGQTVGKKLLGMRIVRKDGSRCTPGRIIGLRYGVGWLITAVPVVGMAYALADSLLIFRESRQCLHDNIADTIVVTV
jgi:uncharacterized RDD family membrane protein YckC